jgi:hypothetical protein
MLTPFSTTTEQPTPGENSPDCKLLNRATECPAKMQTLKHLTSTNNFKLHVVPSPSSGETWKWSTIVQYPGCGLHHQTPGSGLPTLCISRHLLVNSSCSCHERITQAHSTPLLEWYLRGTYRSTIQYVSKAYMLWEKLWTVGDRWHCGKALAGISNASRVPFTGWVSTSSNLDHHLEQSRVASPFHLAYRSPNMW